MEATNLYKNLNNIFEDLYHLYDETIANVDYMATNNTYIENCVIQFTDSFRVECEWDMTDDERQECGEIYFEAGHNDVDAVYYPFDSKNNEIDSVNIRQNLNIWRKLLECIKLFTKEKKYLNKVTELKEKIRNLKY